MNEISTVVGTGPSWGTVIWILVVVVVGFAAYLWAQRKAKNHPEWFREHVETPGDAAARYLASRGYTPNQIKEGLSSWADRDLTAKVAASGDKLPPEIIEAANKIAEYAKTPKP